MEKLCQEKIRSLSHSGFEIHLRESVDSTNNVLKKLAAEGAPDGYLLAAARQTAGRGRLGRSFFSPGGGLYMSLLLRPRISPEQVMFFTTRAAVAVCRALQAAAGVEAQIKWVNDVYVGTRKVCGILTESAISGGVCDWVIIGIGINICEPPEGYPAEISQRAAALYREDNCPPGIVNRLAAAVADSLAEALAQPHAEIAAEYRRRSLVIGKDVELINGSERTKCHVLDIDDDSALIVRLQDGSERAVKAGEVSLKS